MNNEKKADPRVEQLILQHVACCKQGGDSVSRTEKTALFNELCKEYSNVSELLWEIEDGYKAEVCMHILMRYVEENKKWLAWEQFGPWMVENYNINKRPVVPTRLTYLRLIFDYLTTEIGIVYADEDLEDFVRVDFDVENGLKELLEFVRKCGLKEPITFEEAREQRRTKEDSTKMAASDARNAVTVNGAMISL